MSLRRRIHRRGFVLSKGIGLDTRALVILILTPGLIAGCHRGSSAVPAVSGGPASPPAKSEDPVEVLYGQVRAGSYQFSAALDSLSTANELAETMAKSAGGTATQGFKDLLGKLNAAGQDLADAAKDPPSLPEFKADLSAQDDERLSAIDGANDALGELADAQDIVDALLAGAPPSASDKVKQLQADLDETVDAVETGVAAMGGKLDEDPSEGDSPPPAAGSSH